MQLSEIASETDGHVVRDGAFYTLGNLTDERPSLLVRLESERFARDLLQNSHIACVITSRDLASLLPVDMGVLAVEDPGSAFFALHNHLATRTDFYGGFRPNIVAESAIIHSSAHIAEQGVSIGDNVLIEPHVVIGPGTKIHDNCIIRSGTVIGSEGFYFKRQKAAPLPIVHTGGVLVEKGVEIQANCVISRGIFGGDTVIGEDSKIADLVHIAHSCKIGKRCLIAANAALMGYIDIGDDVWIGPGATISNCISIGAGAKISIGSVVIHSVAPEQRVTGNFAVDHGSFLRFFKLLKGKRNAE